MSDGSPALEVGFEIDTLGSFGKLEQLENGMDKATAQIIADAAKIERATAGMVNLGGATAQVRSFGNAMTKAQQDVTREKIAAERAASREIGYLQRQIEAYGKTSAELRELRAEKVALRATDSGLEVDAQQIRDLNAELSRLQGSSGKSADSLGANRSAMAGLSFQAQDAFTQISMGSNVLSVLAIQGGQAAGQMAGMGGALGKVADFMIGPWGLALTAGLLAVGALTKGLFDNSNALDDEVDKLRKDAAETENAAKAKDVFARSLDGVLAALAEQKRALDELADSEKTTAERAVEAAQRERERLVTIRQTTVALLERAKAEERSAAGQTFGAAGGAGAGMARSLYSERAAELEDELGRATAALTQAEKQLVQAQGNLAVEVGERLADPVAQLNRQFDLEVASARRAASAVDIQTGALQRQVTAIRQRQKAAIEEYQETAKARERADGVQRFRTREQAIGIAGRELQQAGFRVDGNVQFGWTGGHANNADHNKFAADVNVGRGVVEANIPDLKKQFDALARLYQSRGFDVIWNRQRYAAGGNGPTGAAKGHENHLHLRAPETIVGRPTQSSSARQGLAEQAKILADQKREYDSAVKAAEDYAAAQLKIGETTGLSAREQRLYADAIALANAPTVELARAIGEAATAREKSLSDNAAAEFDANVLRPLRDELKLYGLVGPKREAAALAMERDGFIAKQVGVDTQKAAEMWEQYYAARMAVIDRGASIEQEKARIDAINDSLAHQLELLDILVGNVDRAGQKMAEAFGPAGQALGDLAFTFSAYVGDQARLREELRLQIQAASELATEEERSRAARQANAEFVARNAGAQIEFYGDMAAAARGFFSEGSDGYKALLKAEQAFRAIQFALSVRAMIQDARETAAWVLNSGARAAADAVAAVAKAIASMPFPLNIAAGAATAAALASIGIAIGGAFSSGGNKPQPSNEGKGTVLGDANAQSQSIKRSLDALKEVDLLLLNSSREMAASLRSIDRQIGGVAAQILRAGDIDANGGVVEGFKPNLIGSVLGSIPLVGGLLKSLFGSTTTVVGSGLFGGPQTLESILSGGFDASYYSDIQKKKKFLGFTTSTRTSTQFSGADAGLESQFTLILSEFSKAISAAAGPLGLATSDIEQKLNGFVVNIGKIELKGLTGEQVQEKLAAVFGAAADQMARTAFPGMERFQRAGEGLFETVVRVSSTVEQVTASLGLLGNAAANLGIDAKVALSEQFDTLGDLASATQTYFDRFFTAQEQAAARGAQLETVFTSLGLTMPSTLASFRSLVEAQNLNTQAGRETYAVLLQLAPAFADLQSALTGARSAADILAERADLERRLFEVQGNTAAIRALDLAKLDPGNRALQEQIWALQDAQEAARAADDLRKAWTDVGTSIADEVQRIRGLANGGAGNTFASAMGQFNAATAAARGGDLEAAKSLPGLSQALLTLAADNARSRQELDRVQAQTAASLEQTMRLLAALGGSATPQTASAMIAAAGAAQPQSAASVNDNSVAEMRTDLQSLRDTLEQLRRDNNAGHAATAGNVGAVKKHLDNVTAASGGEAVSVAA